MNCKRIKLEISLWITDDLNGSSVTNLEEHLARCSDCESYRRSLQESLSDLKAGTSISKLDLNDSIWPGLATELPDYHEMQKRERFNGWMLATAFTVACAAMVTFSSKQNSLGWSGDGADDLDGRLFFSQAADRDDGYLNPRIPRSDDPHKNRTGDSKGEVEANANPNNNSSNDLKEIDD